MIRINVFDGEIIDRIEVAEYPLRPGIRIYLDPRLSTTVESHSTTEPCAITFWSPQDLRTALNKILAELNSLEGINDVHTDRTP